MVREILFKVPLFTLLMVKKSTVSDMTLNAPFYNASTYLIIVEYPH